jgi:hypothetical protein
VGEKLPKPGRPTSQVSSVGNMIEPGQPQHRQLICRPRLAPRSELPLSDLNQGRPFPVEVPKVVLVSCAIIIHHARAVRCDRVATGCETAGGPALVSCLVWMLGRVVPTVSHRISTINAGGMAALLRPETMNPHPTAHSKAVVGSVAAWQMRR